MDVNTHGQIIEILDSVYDMTIATIRADGFPRSTVVAFVHDNLRLYFLTGIAAQMAHNISFCDKVSATITRPYAHWREIEGLSLWGHASEVTEPAERRLAKTLLDDRFPETANLVPEGIGEVAIFRIDPVAISLVDYSKGFGHAELFDVMEKLPVS